MREDGVVSLVIAVAAGFVAGAGIAMGVCKRKEITAELSSEFHGVHDRVNEVEDKVADEVKRIENYFERELKHFGDVVGIKATGAVSAVVDAGEAFEKVAKNAARKGDTRCR